jgi:internalin A
MAQKVQPVEFKDPVLDSVIRRAIEKPSGFIYPSELDGLTMLSADSEDIRSLEGIENCRNLTSVDLFGCAIDDPSALTRLPFLDTIELSRNSLSDVTSLGEIAHLERLSLEENSISDLSPLAKLKHLTLLDVSQNDISDIDPLSGLTSLERLFISRNMISDLRPLVNLERLEIIFLYKNRIVDLSPLMEIPRMRLGGEIDIRDNPLSDEAINDQIPRLRKMGVSVRH